MLDDLFGRRDALRLFASLGAGLAVPSGAATSSPAPDAARLLFLEGADQLYAFRNMDRLFPTRSFRSGDSVSMLQGDPAGIDPRFDFAGRSWTVDSFMAECRVVGLVALKNGSLILERYALGNSATTKWTSFSVAKSLTSTLVGVAIQDRYIDAVTDPVTRYLPSLKGTAFDGTILRDLLRMSSGVRWNENYLDPASDVNTLLTLAARRDRCGAFMRHMASLPRAYPPGTVYQYKTGESSVLGAVVAAAIGGSLSSYVEEKIWKPAGMEADGYWICHAQDDIEWGGGCISATARDYARFGRFMMNDGIVDGRRILPEGWVEEATKPSAPHGPTGQASAYGYQWWTQETPASFRAEGVFGQFVYVNRATNLVVAVQSAWPKPSDRQRDGLTTALFQSLLVTSGSIR